MNGHRAAIPERNGKQTTPKDFIVEPITLQKGLVGAKPARVCRWILDLLNFEPGDELIDLFPGTGIMGIVAREANAKDLLAGSINPRLSKPKGYRTVNSTSPDPTEEGKRGE